MPATGFRPIVPFVVALSSRRYLALETVHRRPVGWSSV